MSSLSSPLLSFLDSNVAKLSVWGYPNPQTFILSFSKEWCTHDRLSKNDPFAGLLCWSASRMQTLNLPITRQEYKQPFCLMNFRTAKIWEHHKISLFASKQIYFKNQHLVFQIFRYWGIWEGKGAFVQLSLAQSVPVPKLVAEVLQFGLQGIQSCHFVGELSRDFSTCHIYKILLQCKTIWSSKDKNFFQAI